MATTLLQEIVDKASDVALVAMLFGAQAALATGYAWELVR